MIFWLDAQLSPQLASWIQETFEIPTHAVRDLDLARAKDREIFLAARQSGATVVTKDSDFLHLVEELGTPPQVLWVTCGNTSNRRLQEIFQEVLPAALKLLEADESVVEISSAG